MTRVAAVQSWPALKNPPVRIPSTADSRSASSKTITGALPPSSRWATLRSGAAAVATAIPARVEPVMEIIRGTGCAASRAPVSRSPQTRLTTPGGKTSCALRTSQAEEAGVVSEGFSTAVLPAASAGASFQMAIIAG